MMCGADYGISAETLLAIQPVAISPRPVSTITSGNVGRDHETWNALRGQSPRQSQQAAQS